MGKKLLASSILTGLLVAGIGFGNHSFAAEGNATIVTESPKATSKATSKAELKAEQSQMTAEQKKTANEQFFKMHEGETPIRVHTDEKTGVVTEVYEIKEQSTIQPFTAGWQEIASDYFDLVNDNQWRVNADKTIAYSHGGDFGLRIPSYLPQSVVPTNDYNKALISYRLYEYDPQNGDDYVGSDNFLGRSWLGYDIVFRNIGDFCDGVNGTASFMLSTKKTLQLTSLFGLSTSTKNKKQEKLSPVF